MPLLPWCSHWRCTPSDIEPPAPDPKYKPNEAGNTHPLENIHVHSITSIFISSDVEKKPLLVSFLKSSFTKNVCISDLSSKSFYQLNRNFSSEKYLRHFFSFSPMNYMTFHRHTWTFTHVCVCFLQYFIEMLIEKFPSIIESWALLCLILSLPVQSGSTWTVLIAATDKQTNKTLKITDRTLTS